MHHEMFTYRNRTNFRTRAIFVVLSVRPFRSDKFSYFVITQVFSVCGGYTATNFGTRFILVFFPWIRKLRKLIAYEN